MKLLIVGWYDCVNNCFAGAINEFKLLGHDCIFFPQFLIKEETKDTDPYPKIVGKMQQMSEAVSFIIFWNWGGSYEYFKNCRNNISRDIKFILYNWDPWSHKHNDYHIFEFFDYVFTCCSYNTPTKFFKGRGWYQLLPGFSEKFHSIDIDDKYKCDVSMVVTNLYDNGDFSNQYIPRRKIVDDIYNSDLNFHLYGPIFLRDKYPRAYKGFISYDVNRKIFSSSTINISTHADCTMKEYLNERVITILGSGGLLLVDKVKDIDKILVDKQHCFYMEKDRGIVSQIKDILSMDKNILDKIRSNGKRYADEHWTYKRWTKFILDRIL